MENFKVCPKCGFVWKDREQFLNDNEVYIVGYQVHFEYLEAGFFLFNHSCKTTFSLEVKEFTDMYDGPVFEKRETGSDNCSGYCLHKDNLERCPAECECAYVREIIQILKDKALGNNP